MILIYQIIALFLFAYTLYFGILALASVLNIRKVKPFKQDKSDEPVTLFIPAYRVGPDFVNHLCDLREEMPCSNVRFYVLFQETKANIVEQSARYLDAFDEKSFRNAAGNPYHHALAFAVKQMKKHWKLTEDAPILLLDPDNVISANSVEILHTNLKQGFDVVQGRRLASKSKTQTGWIDAASEALNDLLWRSGKQQLGLVPELSGSGILFRYRHFSKAVNNLDRSAPGMDKNLLIQLLLAFKDLNLRYCPDAILFDEKTNDAKAFGRQRIRWFGNQYYNAIHWSVPLLLASLKQIRLRYIDYAITLWRPPRSVHALLTVLLVPVDLLLVYFDFISFSFYAPAFLLWMLIVLPVLKQTKPEGTEVSVLSMLRLILGNVKSVAKGVSSKAKGTFISTRENSTR